MKIKVNFYLAVFIILILLILQNYFSLLGAILTGVILYMLFLEKFEWLLAYLFEKISVPESLKSTIEHSISLHVSDYVITIPLRNYQIVSDKTGKVFSLNESEKCLMDWYSTDEFQNLIIKSCVSALKDYHDVRDWGCPLYDKFFFDSIYIRPESICKIMKDPFLEHIRNGDLIDDRYWKFLIERIYDRSLEITDLIKQDRDFFDALVSFVENGYLKHYMKYKNKKYFQDNLFWLFRNDCLKSDKMQRIFIKAIIANPGFDGYIPWIKLELVNKKSLKLLMSDQEFQDSLVADLEYRINNFLDINPLQLEYISTDSRKRFFSSNKQDKLFWYILNRTSIKSSDIESDIEVIKQNIYNLSEN